MSYLQSNYLKVLSALILFLVGLGSLAIYAYDLIVGVPSPQAVNYAVILTLSYCLHQIGYQLGSQATVINNGVADQLSQIVGSSTQTAIDQHVQEEHSTQNAIPVVNAQ